MALRNLLLRFAIGGFFAAISLIVARRRLPAALAAWSERQFDGLFFASYAASRFLVFFTAFFVLHQKPWSDIVAFYVPQAHSVMLGLVPNRDFLTSYAPLNPYLDALLLRLHDSPLTILVFQIVCDVLSVLFWIRFLRRFMNELTLRKAALLYLVQPLVLYEICIDGKNQGLISLLLGIAFWSMARREILSGISFSMSWILVKILPILFLPALFLGARKRVQWLISVLAPSLIVYGAFALDRSDVLAGLRREGSMTTPQNLSYLFAALTGIELPHVVPSLLSLVVLGLAVLIAARAQLEAKADSARLWKTALGSELVLIALMLTNSKSDTSYLAMCFFLLCAYAAFDADRGRRAAVWFYAMLSFLALPVVSFWFWPLAQPMGPQLHSLCLAGDRNAWIMLLMQILLAVSYAGLGIGILRAVREPAFDSQAQES
jgi:hypothetical protein